MNSNAPKLTKTSSLSPSPDGMALLLKSADSPSLPEHLPVANFSIVGQVPATLFPRLSRRTSTPSTAQTGFVQLESWFALALHSRWELYRARLEECRRQPSVESVHQFRVASRRLTAQLSLSRGRRSQKARRMLKRQVQCLGTLRDHHVLRTFLEQRMGKFPELCLLRHQLNCLERDLLKAVARQVVGFKTGKLERCVSGLLEDFPKPSPETPKEARFATTALRRAGEAYAETLERWRLIEMSDLRTIHRTRIAFKRFRYIVESLPPGISRLSKQELRGLASYQRRMGKIQDLRVIQAGVLDLVNAHKNLKILLRRFCVDLRSRRARALRQFRSSANKILEFWPPSGLFAANQRTSRSTRRSL